MNVLLVIGLIILLGAVSGRLFKKLNLPQVTGYMIIGFIIGESFHGILSGPIVESFTPIIDLSLGIIGFMIGAELRFDRFKRYSRSIYTILFTEAFLTFFLVAVTGALFTGKIYIGLILGALSAATAPAATYSVLGEYKARGPVTMTTLSIVALDDALALIIYGFASVFARSLIVHETPSIIGTMAFPIFKILSSVIVGILSGRVLHFILSRTRTRERILPLGLGTIILVVGISIYLKLDPILASMVLGAVVSNLQTSGNREMFDMIRKLSPPIFILFFVLVGAKLDARILAQRNIFFLAVMYILSRSLGKVAGAYVGGRISGAKDTVTKYLGFCLFDQAGVAVGLAIAAFNSFSTLGGGFKSEGLMIISLITATTFILQLVAPGMIRYGIKKADEVNRNVTEEDVVDEYKVSDVMEQEFFVIKENYNLKKIIKIMKESDAYIFPVVGMDGNFLGVISLGEMRDTFNEEQMDELIIAGDMVMPVAASVNASQELHDAINIFGRKKIDYLPVMEKEGSQKLVGQLNYAKVTDYVTKEVLMRQQGLEG